MNENTTNNPVNENPSQPMPGNQYEDRWQRRAERRAARGRNYSASWIFGAILIILGGVFLLQNVTGNFYLQNWWALFILIPSFGALAAAWRMFQDNGWRLTAGVVGSLVVGLVLLAVTGMFLLGLSWTFFGPVLLILAGLGLLITVFLPRK